MKREVEVKVVAGDDHWSREGESWTIYHLRVLTTFKGKRSLHLALFRYRERGGFYLDPSGPIWTHLDKGSADSCYRW